jgi:O-glycosyl hydrolase
VLARALLGVLTIGLLLLGSTPGAARPLRPGVGVPGGAWAETRFHTGCDPGPYTPPGWPDPRVTHVPNPGPPEPASLRVDLDSTSAHRPILGAGFNFEHALWSCPQFRGLFRAEILDPFHPALARVDTGLLPAAPPDVPASELGPAVYQAVLGSEPYADSWRFLLRLNRAGARIVLGVWGAPGQFTDDGDRRGVLEPAHYDDYVEYVHSLVDFVVRQQGAQVWAITIANEPDGGDGSQIPPAGLAYIAHQLAKRLEPYGVKLYGPDTTSADAALTYLPALLDDPVVSANLAFVGFHQYYPSSDVDSLVDFVRARRPDLPVIATEYTSFGFGSLDDGEEVNDRVGFALDVVATLLEHYRSGVDAAIYWDAVDYLQPGHDAITKWGLLRGPDQDFARRKHYYALLQVLPFLQPSARVADSQQTGGRDLSSLAVRTPDGPPAVFLVNQGPSEIDLSLSLEGADAARYPSLVVTQTDRGHNAERLGRLRLVDGSGSLSLPPRSLTTLFPAGQEEPADDDDAGA